MIEMGQSSGGLSLPVCLLEQFHGLVDVGTFHACDYGEGVRHFCSEMGPFAGKS
jgi:hypothetical protein